MPTLFALLIGIDNYPNPRHILRGCRNDVAQMDQYLSSYCQSMGYAYQPLILTDSNATRKGIVQGFDHFDAANEQDCCLLYYAGHGSRSEAPEAFWGLEYDHTLESIVCWDSRQPGGNDLMDKELSFLIWKASQGKHLPFISIMDCCHAGKMRSDHFEIEGIRNLRDVGATLPPEQFEGIAHYKKTEKGQLSPPLGRRVQLAAARDTEFAKEINAGGKPHGIFTYCLLDTLRTVGPVISYADLLNRANLRIRQNVQDQSAQLDATFTDDRILGFLFSKTNATGASYLVSWDQQLGWVLNAGALQGIPESTDASKTTLELTNNGHVIEVLAVLPNQSKVSGMATYNIQQVYPAIIRKRAKPKMQLAFAPDSDPAGVGLLQTCLQNQASDAFQLSDTTVGSTYWMHANRDRFYLTRPLEETPLFPLISGYSTVSANTFLRRLDKVANWQQLLELKNQQVQNPSTAIQIELFRLSEPRPKAEMDNDAPMERVDWQVAPAVFPYFQVGSVRSEPAFQLMIRNNGTRKYWVSVVYLSSDFSMSNQLLPKAMLDPGQEIWASEIFNGQPYRTIPLQIDPIQIQQGWHVVKEYLKIIVSTEELNTDFYLQTGVIQDEHTRAFGRQAAPEVQDWWTETVTLQIEI